MAPDVMEKHKWTLNPRNQASLEASHVFKYKSLLNHKFNDLEIKSGN
jgi:hypothetical protein